MKKLIPPSADLQLVPAEDGIFFVTLSNINRIDPNRLEGRSFCLTAAYDADGHETPLEITVNQVILPGELNPTCTKLLLTGRQSGQVLGTVAIGMFMAAMPKEIHETF